MENEDGTPPNWRSRALCSVFIQQGTIADLWFSDNPEEQELAVGTCFNCPVRLECLKAVVDNKEPHGIWGGLTQERRFLNNKHRSYSSLKGLTDE